MKRSPLSTLAGGVTILTLLTFVPSSMGQSGSWPESRQGPSLTGIQPLPGRMSETPVRWTSHDLGKSSVALSRVATPGATQENRALAVVAGALHCYDPSGSLLWEIHPKGLNFSQVSATGDFDKDGDVEILLQAGRTAVPFGAAVLVSLEKGEILWRYDVEPMSYSWFLQVGEFLQDSEGRRQIAVLMHGYPPDKKNGYLALFEFREPGTPPTQKWRYDFDQYTCFPTLLQVDWDCDGTPEICIETHSRMWFLDAATGTLEHFVGWDVAPANVRSYGHIEFTDFDRDGDPDFLCIATFSQHHEVLLNGNGTFEKAWSHGWGESVTTGKVATLYPTPPYADIDGDGTLELVVSMYNSEGRPEWLLRTYDILTGKLERTYPRVLAGNLGDMDGDGRVDIGCNRCLDSTGQTLSGAVVLSVSGETFTEIWEDSESSLPRANKDGLHPDHGFLLTGPEGNTSLTLSVTGQSQRLPAPTQKERKRAAGKADFSAVPATLGNLPSGLLSADLTGEGTNELILWRNDRVEILSFSTDGSLQPIASWESHSEPCIADLDGNGSLEIVSGTVGPLVAPTLEARSLKGTETSMWKTVLPATDREGLPQPRRLYLRSGKFTGRKGYDVYVWAGTPLVRSLVVEGDRGTPVWEKGQVPDHERYWGPSVNLASVWDANGDGCEDLVFTNPDYYCVASGNSGELLVGPLFPPEIFQQPSQGLYTFPALLDRPTGGPLVALVSGHYFQGVMTSAGAPLWYDLPPAGESRCSTEGFLSTADGQWLLGVGRQNGKFSCLDAKSGGTRWELDLEASCATPASVDVDGDGQLEFVIGTSHGDLLAVGDGGTQPRMVWRTTLPAGTGDPIAADLNGDGASELAVPLLNGEIWVLGPRKP